MPTQTLGGSSNLVANLVLGQTIALTGLDLNVNVLQNVNVTIQKLAVSTSSIAIILPSIASLDFRQCQFNIYLNDFGGTLNLSCADGSDINGSSTQAYSLNTSSNIKIVNASVNNWYAPLITASAPA